MFKRLRNLRRNKLIAKRLVALLNLSISHGKDQRDILSHIRHSLYISYIGGDKITLSDLHAWRLHWLKALEQCYFVSKESENILSKEEKSLLVKTERDFIHVLSKFKNIEVLKAYMNIVIEYEKYELASYIRSAINDIEYK